MKAPTKPTIKLSVDLVTNSCTRITVLYVHKDYNHRAIVFNMLHSFAYNTTKPKESSTAISVIYDTSHGTGAIASELYCI